MRNNFVSKAYQQHSDRLSIVLQYAKVVKKNGILLLIDTVKKMIQLKEVIY